MQENFEQTTSSEFEGHNELSHGSFREKFRQAFDRRYPENSTPLSSSDLFSLTEILSHIRNPDQSLRYGNTDIKIYRTTRRLDEREDYFNGNYFPETSEQFYDMVFRSPLERRLVTEARRSYSAYGDVPPIDPYDGKSQIYYVQFTYPGEFSKSFFTGEDRDKNISETANIREGVFLRYVPYEGTPFANEDFDLYVVNSNGRNIPLIDYIKEKTGDSDVERRIVTQSRFCTIRPFVITKNQEAFDKNGKNQNHFLEKNAYSHVGFALATKQYFTEHEHEFGKPAIITGQLHKHLSDGILSFRGASLPFMTASEYLGLDEKAVQINRSDPDVEEYIYKYSGYFLNVPAMVDTIDELIEAGYINEQALGKFLPHNKTWDMVRARKSMMDWGKFSEMFLNDNVEGRAMTAKELRAIINTRVPDGPVLRIMREEQFSPRVNQLISVAENYMKSIS